MFRLTRVNRSDLHTIRLILRTAFVDIGAAHRIKRLAIIDECAECARNNCSFIVNSNAPLMHPYDKNILPENWQ